MNINIKKELWNDIIALEKKYTQKVSLMEFTHSVITLLRRNKMSDLRCSVCKSNEGYEYVTETDILNNSVTYCKKCHENKNRIHDPRICKRCGCDFPNIPVYKKGCGACETPNEMFKKSMSIFN